MSTYRKVAADHGHKVDAEKAREHLPQSANEWINLSRRDRVLADLSYTVVQQAEQLATTLALHQLDPEHLCVEVRDGSIWRTPACTGCNECWPCPTARALGVES